MCCLFVFVCLLLFCICVCVCVCVCVCCFCFEFFFEIFFFLGEFCSVFLRVSATKNLISKLFFLKFGKCYKQEIKKLQKTKKNKTKKRQLNVCCISDYFCVFCYIKKWHTKHRFVVLNDGSLGIFRNDDLCIKLETKRYNEYMNENSKQIKEMKQIPMTQDLYAIINLKNLKTVEINDLSV